MVVFIDKGREEELIEIWKRSFGDSEEYIRMFFKWNLEKVTVIAYEVDGKAVSVAYLLPVTYEKAGHPSIPCRYLYAAATLPEYRGHGCFSKIMKALHEKITEPVLLVPGEKSLISYYQKQGMHLWLEEQTLEISEVQENHMLVKTRDVSPSEYASKREKCLLQNGYIKWDEHFMNYIFDENIACGGCQKVLSVFGEEYIIMYRVEGNVLKIFELLPQGELLNQENLKNSPALSACVQLLLKETGCQKAQVYLRPIVMITPNFPALQNEGYFNLTLG